MNFGYVYMQLLLNTSCITIYNFSFRQAIGPIIGGALTEMMDFQTSAVVSFSVLHGSIALGLQLGFSWARNFKLHSNTLIACLGMWQLVT